MKIPHDSISEELLARYFEQTAAQEEIDHVDQWADQSPENARDLEVFRIIWDASHRNSEKKAYDTDAAWNNVSKKMGSGLTAQTVNGRNAVHSDRVKRNLWPKTLMAAAVALLAIAFGWFQFKNNKIQTETALTTLSTHENAREALLPDGTKVFLNYHSKITYPEHFSGEVRTVTLTGEAFFQVQRDTLHPFIVHTNGGEIKVLGTSFNVRAYDKMPVRVDVSTGKVLVRNAIQEMYLIKNQSAEVLADTVRMVLPLANLTSYRTNIYEFSATQLEDVVSSIRNGYHADVRLGSDHLSQCRLTIRFEKEPLEETLSVIAESLSLKLRKDGKTYWLEGQGCQ